jgi:hypothetical protein
VDELLLLTIDCPADGGIRQTGADQIPPEIIQSGGGGALHSEIHKLIKLIWNKEELPHQWKESIVVPIPKTGDKT